MKFKTRILRMMMGFRLWPLGRNVDGGYTSSKKKQQSELNEHKSISTAYKPMSEPKCSQCGKPFRPEKLHSHMKSCRGIKALTKTADTLC